MNDKKSKVISNETKSLSLKTVGRKAQALVDYPATKASKGSQASRHYPTTLVEIDLISLASDKIIDSG